MKVKDAFGWPGDIKKEDGIGVWIGELPSYLRTLGTAESNSEVISNLPTSENIDADDAKVSMQDIASYQVNTCRFSEACKLFCSIIESEKEIIHVVACR